MDFQLASTSGKLFQLSKAKTPLVLFFYPRDNTPGCTLENQEFSKLYLQFKKLGFDVLGISRDKLTTHYNFQKKHSLNHHLLADIDEVVCNLFQVMKEKNMYGKKVRGISRSTFIIDQNKTIIKEWREVKVENHVAEVLEFISNLESQ